MHNFDVQINNKLFRRKTRDMAESKTWTEQLLEDVNYDLENRPYKRVVSILFKIE